MGMGNERALYRYRLGAHGIFGALVWIRGHIVHRDMHLHSGGRGPVQGYFTKR